MRVEKVLNNNVVSLTNDHHNEIIVMGKGIGFQKKVGDLIDDSSIEKVFVLNDATIVSKMGELFKYISDKYLEISDEIIQYARDEYGFALKDNIYLSLTDHISLAVERINQGMEISNVMLSDIKCFYQKEYKIGLKALEIINHKLGVLLPDDEAGFIALHILNSSLDQVDTNNLEAIRLAHEILTIVKDFYRLNPDEESIHYYRFMNHINFLAKRLISQTEDIDSDDILYGTARRNFPKEFECASLINRYTQEKFGISISKEEQGYLMINLRALLKKVIT